MAVCLPTSSQRMSLYRSCSEHRCSVAGSPPSTLKDLVWTSLLRSKDRPDVSVLTYFWNVAEDVVLEAWLGKVIPLGSKHLSLHFDVNSFCQSCTEAIYKATDLLVTIREKEHHSFSGFLKNITDSAAVECPEILCETGNCILAALYHLGLQESALSMASMTEGPEHAFFRRRRQRKYVDVAEKLKLSIFPRIQPSVLKSGQKVLLHIASDGNPHCVALEMLTDTQVRITDVRVSYNCSVQHLLRMLSAASDRKYILFFHLQQKPGKNAGDALDDDYESLLDSMAGGSEEDLEDRFVYDLDVQENADEDDDDVSLADESITHVGDELLQYLKDEVEKHLNGCLRRRGKKKQTARCPFCPFRSWPISKKARVLEHVRLYHSPRKQFVPSGTKQLKLIVALHDYDQCQGRDRGNYLYRSSRILRNTVTPPLSSKHVLVDRELRLVLTAQGPEFWNVLAVQQQPLRRVRNLYYTHGFGQILYREMLICKAKVSRPQYDACCDSSICRLRRDFTRMRVRIYCLASRQVYAFHARMMTLFSPETCSLLPRHSKHWWPIVEDVFMSKKPKELKSRLLDEMLFHEEFQVLSMDATLRCCLSLMGQAHPRARREVKDSAVFVGDEALTRAS